MILRYTDKSAISFPFVGSLNIRFLQGTSKKKDSKSVATQPSLSWVEHEWLVVSEIYFSLSLSESVWLSIFLWGKYKQEELGQIMYLEIKHITSGGKVYKKRKGLEKCAFWWIITSKNFNGIFVRFLH